MSALGIFGLFLVQSVYFSSSHFVVKHGSLRAEGGGFYDFLGHFMDDLHEKSKWKNLQDRSTVLQGQAPSPLASALRLEPEYFNKLVSYFEYLDKNSDQKLSEWEFIKVTDYDTSLRKDGREIYDLFSVADDKPGMTLQEFLRLVTVVTKGPKDFKWHAEDLKALPSETVGEDQDRDALFRLFAVFDENSSGDVSIAEFEHAWMGPTLWECRKKGLLSSAWLVSQTEFDYAKGLFADRAGADNVLSLGEFAHLLKDAVPHRDDNYAKGSPYTGPLEQRGPFKDSSHHIRSIRSAFITFAFGAMASLA
jgi:Ca2+-binding EF-hand superfamily protein